MVHAWSVIGRGFVSVQFCSQQRGSWLVAENGVRFEGYGQVYGPTPLAHSGGPALCSSSALNCWSVHTKDPRESVERLFSIQERSSRNILRSSGGRKIWSLPVGFATHEGRSSFERLFCGHIFATPAIRFVTITTGPEGTSVYLEGRSAATLSRVGVNALRISKAPCCSDNRPADIRSGAGRSVVLPFMTPVLTAKRWLRIRLVGAGQLRSDAHSRV